MNKHVVCSDTLADFQRDFAVLQDCLKKCGETIVKVRLRFNFSFSGYKAKVWSEPKKGDEK